MHAIISRYLTVLCYVTMLSYHAIDFSGLWDLYALKKLWRNHCRSVHSSTDDESIDEYQYLCCLRSMFDEEYAAFEHIFTSRMHVAGANMAYFHALVFTHIGTVPFILEAHIALFIFYIFSFIYHSRIIVFLLLYDYFCNVKIGDADFGETSAYRLNDLARPWD